MAPAHDVACIRARDHLLGTGVALASELLTDIKDPATRPTEMPTSIGGFWSAWNSRASSKSWPSVIEIRLVGM
jgi:hypothetical protein